MTGLNTATLAPEHTTAGEIEAVSQETILAQKVIVTAHKGREHFQIPLLSGGTDRCIIASSRVWSGFSPPGSCLAQKVNGLYLPPGLGLVSNGSFIPYPC